MCIRDRAYTITDTAEYMAKLHEIEDYFVGEKQYVIPLMTQTPVISVSYTHLDVYKRQELDRENFAVRQHLRYVERFANPESYMSLSYEDTLHLKEEVAPLLYPDEDEASAVRFDALMYGIELAYLAGKKYAKARSDLFKKVSDVAGVANIPEIRAQSELLEKILHTDYLDNAGLNEFEYIRKHLRGLMKLSLIHISPIRCGFMI